MEILSVGCYFFRKDEENGQYISSNGEKFNLDSVHTIDFFCIDAILSI